MIKNRPDPSLHVTLAFRLVLTIEKAGLPARINTMKIEYAEISDAFDFVSFGQPFEHQAFLNRESGKIYWHSEFGDNEEELPDDIDDIKYIEIPHKNDLGLGKKLAINFIYRNLPNESEEIEAIFRRKGAYRRFKAMLENNDLIDAWYEYESNAMDEALREWCQFSEIEVQG